ncbi:arginine--tRNA ligase [Shouchella lonarensis]|uniref:arginine--tRNA ligase n=1 Tax=Shouchella lonarensis TaxID=1464122 RepID=A0A1G6LCG1_9BACI|nr:arginine--tRNA ligase [Shouchella lonarensis]SDC40637.1 arginyl-tRNA synthetase [Shouchella lonarensis]
MKEQLHDLIATAAANVAGTTLSDWTLEQPAQLAHGDFSTNIALKAARVLKRKPIDIAGDFVAALSEMDTPFLESVEVVQPGFINFFIDWDEALRIQAEAGLTTKQEKVLIEHTSINPNKSAHIGHLRNACIGDTIARLLAYKGKHVEVHNYIDDLGNQLADTLVGLLSPESTRPDEKAVRFGDYCWDVYSSLNEAYEDGRLSTSKREDVLHQLEAGDNHTSWLGYAVANKIAEEHVAEMGEFAIDYDLLVWERHILQRGFWEKAFAALQQTDVFFKETSGPQAGCWVLKTTTTENDDQTSTHQANKVLVRSNGVLTYTAKDIAYHMWKFGLLAEDFTYARKSDKLWTTDTAGQQAAFGHADVAINVIDYRQAYPQQVVKQALAASGFTEAAANLRHVSYGVVSLSKQTAGTLGVALEEGKNVYAMSGRKGIGIKIKELIAHMEEAVRTQSPNASEGMVKKLARAAIRYNMLRYNTTSDIIFDLDEATQVTGNTGIYLMYTYARASSIAKKAQDANIDATGATFKACTDVERAVLKQLAGWPNALAKAERDLEPNVLCTFAFELASLYNRFYAECPVLKAEPDIQSRRLALTKLVREQLETILHVLGLPAEERI